MSGECDDRECVRCSFCGSAPHPGEDCMTHRGEITEAEWVRRGEATLAAAQDAARLVSADRTSGYTPFGVDMEPHTMVKLAGGGWTCDCGTIQASTDQRDVFIHVEWALREQCVETRRLLILVLETHYAAAIASIERDLYAPQYWEAFDEARREARAHLGFYHKDREQ